MSLPLHFFLGSARLAPLGSVAPNALSPGLAPEGSPPCPLRRSARARPLPLSVASTARDRSRAALTSPTRRNVRTGPRRMAIRTGMARRKRTQRAEENRRLRNGQQTERRSASGSDAREEPEQPRPPGRNGHASSRLPRTQANPARNEIQTSPTLGNPNEPDTPREAREIGTTQGANEPN
jgi:hypothetical protein